MSHTAIILYRHIDPTFLHIPITIQPPAAATSYIIMKYVPETYMPLKYMPHMNSLQSTM